MHWRNDWKFVQAVGAVLEHEGGYVNDPDDPGGETKWGISRRSYPELDIANLTEEQACAIYYRDWWRQYKYDLIEDATVAAKVLDLSVNMGPSAAHKCLQRALHACGRRDVTIDGIIGPQTLEAVNSANPLMLLAALRAEAAAHYRALAQADPKRQKFLNGWLNRAYA